MEKDFYDSLLSDFTTTDQTYKKFIANVFWAASLRTFVNCYVTLDQLDLKAADEVNKAWISYLHKRTRGSYGESTLLPNG